MSNLEAKIDKLDEKVDAISITLVQNTAILEEHQRRSSALEAIVQRNELDVQPLKDHVNAMKIGFKAIGWFCGALAGLAGLLLTLKMLGLL